MADAFKGLNSVRAGRGRGTRAVLPAPGALEARVPRPGWGPDFIWSVRGHEQDASKSSTVTLWLLSEDSEWGSGEMFRGGEGWGVG